ncbi:MULTISPECIES: DinB family protein [Micrococcaceae]|uniref:DinB family protein n=1 Tax=Micrococcaceae TaxID=1268 RepID=UPI0010E99028|nr:MULTISPECIES: DinB family protein [Micrococcaceae]TAP25960.1 DinB family protein [Arthrobacter sp. S41]UXN31881.1 DinB family protein [Glutamicibacter sp. M10]
MFFIPLRFVAYASLKLAWRAKKNDDYDMSEIVPDQKNWTFVLDSVCPECQVDVREVTPKDVIERLPSGVQRYVTALHNPAARVRKNPARWSDQEYVTHVAHMLVIMTQRLDLMLGQDEPTFPNWDQDQAANEGNYNALTAGDVTAQLETAASNYAEKLGSIGAESYSRRGLRSNGSAFTVESLNQYAWHDFVHHLWDLDPKPS